MQLKLKTTCRTCRQNCRFPVARLRCSKPNNNATRKRLSAIAAAFLLTACAGNNVVTHPVALNKIDEELMRKPRDPRCALPRRPVWIDGRVDARELDAYSKALEAYSNCWKQNWQAATALVVGLQAAVQVREAAADNAVAAAKF